MEKGVLEPGTKGWVGVYLSEREKAFQAEGIASAKVQRHVMWGRRESLVELLIRGWGKSGRRG